MSTVTTRIPFETYMRAAAMQMLLDYAQDMNLSLQKYPGRPASLYPPTAYVERIRETIDWDGAFRKRHVFVDVRVIWGLFDSKVAVDQRDAFVDGFVEWVTDHPHAAFATTVIEPRTVEDDPEFVADWLKLEDQGPYFSSTITLEGFAGGY